MTTLSVVIPAYNEEAGIAEIMKRVIKVRDNLCSVGINEVELLVVDDGSHDHTVDIAKSIAETSRNVKVVSHITNKGYGAALKTGFCLASGDLIGFLDADGTYPPEYFPQLCQESLNGADLVIGSRMAGARSEMPVTRRIGNMFFANLLTLLGTQKVTDSASGMRVFNREILKQIYPLPDGLNLTPVMSARALHENIKMVEVPIPYSERKGRSKLSVIRDGAVFLQSILWTVLSYNPVRILGSIGFLGILLALISGLWLGIERLSGITQLGYWGVAGIFIGLVSGVCGVSVFALGATFNYLVALMYKKPIRQGMFGKPLFTPSLDHHFGWIGIVCFVFGVVLGAIILGFSLQGWEITRLWLYMLGSAMFLLVGLQLVIYWLLMRVLENVSQREDLSQLDLQIPGIK